MAISIFNNLYLFSGLVSKPAGQMEEEGEVWSAAGDAGDDRGH